MDVVYEVRRCFVLAVSQSTACRRWNDFPIHPLYYKEKRGRSTASTSKAFNWLTCQYKRVFSLATVLTASAPDARVTSQFPASKFHGVLSFRFIFELACDAAMLRCS